MGLNVTVEGVVIASYSDPNGISGWFVEEQDAERDNNPSTAEGIFVYTADTPARVELGDVVRVSGTVSEYHGLTELTEVADWTTCSTGASVTPVTLSLPLDATFNLESLEGMSVRIPQPLFVADTSNLGQFGQLILSSESRLSQPTGLVSPGPAAESMQAQQRLTTIELDDGSCADGPQPVPYLADDNTLRLGDSIQGLSGVLTNSFDAYQIEPFTTTHELVFIRDNTRPLVPDDPGGSLRVASFNLSNYFTTPASSGSVCGPNADQTCRGAQTPAEFQRQRAKTLSALLALDADIYALSELENNETESIRDIVDGLNSQQNAHTYSFVDTGVLGSDVIKVAIAYDTLKVRPLGAFAQLNSAVDPRFDDRLSRPVVAQTFQQISDAERFTLAVTHLKSKGSSCAGDPDTGDGQGNCNLTRVAAVRALSSWLAIDPTASGDPDLLLVGDFNCYAREDPVQQLVASGFINLAAQFIGDSAYSFAFDGRVGTLDYAFASQTFIDQVTGITEWHINADEPAILDYKVDDAPLGLYAPNPYRSSDHDPVIVGLSLHAK